MRSFFVLLLALSFVSASAAQTPQAPSRWTLSAGPEWLGYRGLSGIRMRANYHLLNPDGWARLSLQAGALWGPTQRFHHTFRGLGAVTGDNQTVDLTFGLSAALGPFPRARLSPYITFGVLARQMWSHGQEFLMAADGSTQPYAASRPPTYGNFVFPVGLGLKARIGGRSFQFEIQAIGEFHDMTVGTRLPF